MIIDIVKTYVAPAMRRHGFKKRGMLWNREQGELIHVVQLQKSQWNEAESGSFTLNIGICVRQLWEILWDKDVPTFVGEIDCFPRYRVGELLGISNPTKDLWWSISPATSRDAIGIEVRTALQEKCLPFLGKCICLADVLKVVGTQERWSSPAEKLSFAILNQLNGRSDVAQSIVGGMESDKKLTAWYGRIREVRERLTRVSG